jgi:hypothetical protein
VSGQFGWVHAGLGASENAELRVTWPDGTVGPWQQLAADRFFIVERGAEPRTWSRP